MKKMEVYDLVLNLIILGFLIAIIVLLIKCQKLNREKFSLSPAPVVFEKGEQWKNERFFRESEFVLPDTDKHRLVATSPVHAHLEALNNQS